MKKPTILIINEQLPKYDYLKNTYDLHYVSPNYEESPFTQAENILADLQKKQITVEGVFALLDFHSEISSIIAEKLSLPHASTESIYKAQNKALFADLMREAQLPYPDTVVFDITCPEVTLPYPYFIRPVRGSFSAGAFMIKSESDLQSAKILIQNDEKLVPNGFEAFLLHYDPRLKPVRNRYIAQPYINAKQFIADGFVYDKKVHLFALTKATYTKDRKSFMRYDYPVSLPLKLQKKLLSILQSLLDTLAYNNAGFNLEFFLTPQDEIIIIELNTRITPGFLNLFETRLEISPFEMMIDISLGKMPRIVEKKTKQVAAGFPLRLPYDCMVTDVPTDDERKKITSTLDILELEVLVKKDTKLSDYRQDAYSFCYGRVDIAGKNIQDIKQKLAKFMKHLPIKLQKI